MMLRIFAATLVLVVGLVPAGPVRAQGKPGTPAPSGPEAGSPAAQAPAQTASPGGDQGTEGGQGGDQGELPLPGQGGLEPYAPETQPPAEARTPHTICQGRTIHKILVKGAQRVDPDDIRATLKLNPGTICTDIEVTQGVRALWNLGFFDDIVVEGNPVDTNQIDLTVQVKERPAIGKVVYTGNHHIDTKDIKGKVSLREGEILSVPEVQKQVQKIRNLYASKGYFLAHVKYELHKLPGNRGEVEVQFVIHEGGEVTVRRIRFVGNRHISRDELEKIMQTKETGIFSFISSGNKFNRDNFDQDMLRIQAYYYDKGYLEMQPGTPRIELTPDRKHIDITIPVTEGPRFKIGKLRVAEVNAKDKEVEPLGGRKHLQQMLTEEPGDWFSRSKIGKSLQDIKLFYQDRGYAKVQVTPETSLHQKDHVVDIRVAIQRGPLVRIERITISGNTKTRDDVIRREITINESDLYNKSEIEQSKERITRLGYFNRVDVSEEDGSRPDLIVLDFHVSEKATGTFQVGAGFSSVEKFILTAQIQQENLFGNGQSLSLQLQLSGLRQLGQIQFVEPYFLGSKWSLSASAFKTIDQYPDFVRDSEGGTMSLGHPILDERLRAFVRYNGEYVKISARTGGLFGIGGRISQNLPRGTGLHNLFQSGFTSSLTFALTWDSRNNRLFPTNGWYASASAEVADKFLGSQNIFTRYEAFARFYHKLWGPLVLKMNTQFGLITSRDKQGVPVYERYFLGGIYNVRGFDLNSLGPRIGTQGLDPTASPSALGTAIGGNLEAYYNLEVEFPIIKSVGIRGVVFTDGGNAWNLEKSLCQAPDPLDQTAASDACRLDLTAIRTSWGFGFRWFSPLGPLRFEWGLPFKPKPFEKKIVFEFTIGNFF